jgi:hypothetical protein
VNALSCQCGSSTTAGNSSAVSATCNWSALVHFPVFIVEQIQSLASHLFPDTIQFNTWTYKNVRIDFDGQGWLGFESILKALQPLGIAITSTYLQAFPFVNQASQIQVSDLSNNQLIQVNTFGWTSVLNNKSTNCIFTMPTAQESQYEGGAHTYNVNISNQYDSFANIFFLNLNFKNHHFITRPYLIHVPRT